MYFIFKYFDVQKADIVIHNEQELHTAFQELMKNLVPESINLISSNSDIFTIAMGAEFGFIQFESSSPQSPYLIAVDTTRREQRNQFREVDAGGTPTPIPEYACLSPEQVTKIVICYFQNGEIPKHLTSIEWEDA